MIPLPSARESLEKLLSYLVDGYMQKQERMKGIIQLRLTYKNEQLEYCLNLQQEGVTVTEGCVEKPTVQLVCSYHNWLELASGRLHPAVGVITRKLVFSGDIPFFKKFMADCIPTVDVSQYADPPSAFEKNPVKHWVKPNKVLVLNGSPRGEEGYTNFFLKYFLEGVTEECATVKYITVKDKNIAECKGCRHCVLDGEGRCAIKDDMDEIFDARGTYDMVIFAVPLYVDGMPSLMKKVLERWCGGSYPVFIEGMRNTRRARRIVRDSSLVLFSTCGFSELSCFDALSTHFKAISHSYHMPLVAEILRPASEALIHNPLHYTKLCAVIDALKAGGKELVRTGRISRTTIKQISQPFESPEIYRERANMYWQKRIEEFRNSGS